METLSRARPKELAHDYLERESGAESALVSSLVVSQWEKERKADHERPSTRALETNDLDAKQQAAAERWAARKQNAQQPTRDSNREPNRDHSPYPENENTPGRTRPGPEDDL
jgi:hypothetical protein